MRELLALAFWVYALLKLFVVDLDLWMVEAYAPSLGWLVRYRGLVLLALLAIAVFACRRKAFLGWVSYIVFYPFVLLFWRLPKLLIKAKSWTLALALLAAGASFFRALRFTFIVASSLVIGTVVALAAESHWLLGVSGILLLGALVAVYLRTLIQPFRARPDIFSDKALDKIWSFLRSTLAVSKYPRDTPVEEMTADQRQAWVMNLQISVLYNRACYFIASKLSDLKRSHLNAAAYILRVLMLFCLTVWSFSLAALALFKIWPTDFRVSGSPAPFDFLWYGFHSVYGRMISDVVPVSPLARLLFIAANVFGALILGVVVIFVYNSVQSVRSGEKMEATARKIRHHADSLEAFVGKEFGMSVSDAVEQLAKTEAAFIGLIYYLSTSLPRDPPDQ
ncbi:MAG: hypothetical protein M0000_10620 [Actinomycetota bacterium]|nr:hypothetical protein [Actinomycetota bacterium]